MTSGTAPAVVARRGRPRSEAVDAAILDAAIEEIIDVGFFAMSMESVAARAGVAKTTVYRRWPDTAELGVDALQRLKGSVGEPPDVAAREQILWLAERMRRTWNDPTFSAAMRRVAAEGTTDPELFRAARDRLVGPHLRSMNAAIERAKAEGLIRADVAPTTVRRMIVAPTIAAAFTLQPPMSAADLELTVDTVLRGLAP